MKFKNLVTGNTLVVKNAKTAALMRNQKDTYQEIVDKPKAPKKDGKLSTKLTTEELEQIALAEGVDLTGCTTNEQRRAAIELARENQAEE